MADILRWVVVGAMFLGFCVLVWKESSVQYGMDRTTLDTAAEYAARAVQAADNAQERADQAETWDTMDGPVVKGERSRCMEMANMWARVAEANAIAADFTALAKRAGTK